MINHVLAPENTLPKSCGRFPDLLLLWSAFPFRNGKSGGGYLQHFSEAYSSGHCPGLSPDSLLCGLRMLATSP